MSATASSAIKCGCCGAQPRLGVWFPSKKLVILDRVLAAGDAGISCSDLCPGDSGHYFTIKAHVYQINVMLEETDWVIRSDRGRGVSLYRLRKRQGRS